MAPAPDEPIVVVSAAERREADPTSGMVREEAIAVEGLWAGLVRTEAHGASGWHHHGDHESSIYVVDGAMRLEFGPGGDQVVDAGPGDFVRVPKGVVHRESNPAEDENHLVVVRAGTGPPTINVAGPPGLH